VSFRPQFPFETPEGFEDFELVQYFDQFNAAGLSFSLAAGAEILGVPLLLEPNVEYRIRAVQVDITLSDPLGIRFRDPYGNYLSDDFVPVASYSGQSEASVGACPVTLESEIVCPPGGAVLVDLKNLS
jgi:hypothetical protein